MVGVAATPTIPLPYPYHTPTILLLHKLLLNNFATIEISRQNINSYQFPHLLPLRIKYATIKGKNISLGRENLLAGLPVKTPSSSSFFTLQQKIRHTSRNIFTSF